MYIVIKFLLVYYLKVTIGLQRDSGYLKIGQLFSFAQIYIYIYIVTLVTCSELNSIHS